MYYLKIGVRNLEPIFAMEPVSSDTIPNGEDWIAQIKWDGVRILTYAEDQEVRLYNRKKNERHCIIQKSQTLVNTVPAVL
jgi:bifunctional non-homologous end joining protein LigD